MLQSSYTTYSFDNHPAEAQLLNFEPKEGFAIPSLPCNSLNTVISVFSICGNTTSLA